MTNITASISAWLASVYDKTAAAAVTNTTQQLNKLHPVTVTAFCAVAH